MDLKPDEIRGALEAVLARSEWSQSPRMSRFLRFIVERTAVGEGTSLKETVVGVEVFDREPGYDPKIDPVVRVEARRLRLKLQEYYSGSGADDPIRIVLPKGTYQPQFERAAREQAPATVQPEPAPPVYETKPIPRAEGAKWIWTGVGVAAVVVLAAGGWLAIRRPSKAPSAPATPKLITGYQGYSRSPAFSPDGRWIAYSRNQTIRRSNLYLQPMEGGEARPFTKEATFDSEPAWSPDGQSIAFLREMERSRYALMVRPVTPGGVERRIGDVAVRGPLDWAPDGKAVIAADRDDVAAPSALFRIDVSDGRKIQITSPPKGTPGDSNPRVSPDGRWIGFVRATEASVQDVYLVSLEGKDLRRVSSENHVVEGLSWHGSEPQIVASLQRGGEFRSLWRIYLDGRVPERIPEAGIGPVSPAVSRKGDQLAYVTRLSDTNVWTGTVADGKVADARAVTRSIQLDTSPQLSPDGEWIAWRSTSSGTNEVWIGRKDGSEARQLTHMNGPTTGSAHWSPDGKWIVFDSRPHNNGDLFRIPAAGGSPQELTKDASNEVLPSYSRDGRWIYFSTDRSGVWEIWRMTAEGAEARRIAGGGAFNATESPDGKWLYYTRQGGTESGIWRLPIDGGAEEKLTAELTPNFWGQWTVSNDSVFFAVFPPAGNRRAISRLNLASRQVTDVFSLAKMPVQFDSGMCASADGKQIFWSQLDQAGSDVFVVAGWR